MALKTVAYKNKNFDLVYDLANCEKNKTIVFLHGWGSNKEIMKQAFLNHLPDFRHIYLDLPGFGKSQNSEILTTHDYANIVEIFIKNFCEDKNYTAFGHSFGGKIASLLQPQNLVLLSSAGILEQKPLKVKLKIFFAKVLNFLGLSKITKIFRSADANNLNEAMYKTFKNVVNEDFSDVFKNFPNKAFIFWGEEDRATSLQSGKKIHDLIKNSEFVAYEGDHYFFMKNAKNISQRLENAIL